jgi:hypothetical protein
MQRRFLEHVRKAAFALIALLAVTIALYVQLVERKSRQEADRVWAVRLEAELTESRARLEAETQSRLRAEAEIRAAEQGDQPAPNTVLRRGESEGNGRLQQTPGSRDAQQAALTRLQDSLDALERRSEQSDRTLRRDLEELRAEVRREQEASGKVQSLLLVALVPLLLHLLASLWPRRDRRRGDE